MPRRLTREVRRTLRVSPALVSLRPTRKQWCDHDNILAITEIRQYVRQCPAMFDGTITREDHHRIVIYCEERARTLLASPWSWQFRYGGPERDSRISRAWSKPVSARLFTLWKPNLSTLKRFLGEIKLILWIAPNSWNYFINSKRSIGDKKSGTELLTNAKKSTTHHKNVTLQ